jgi:phospholipase C
LDFFGGGTRIPLLVISPYAKPGFIDHTYYDHAPILKFIEANWGLPELSVRSRDNLPNPIASGFDPYRPLNSPAIGDLMGLFDFTYKRNQNETRSSSRAGSDSHRGQAALPPAPPLTFEGSGTVAKNRFDSLSQAMRAAS